MRCIESVARKYRSTPLQVRTAMLYLVCSFFQRCIAFVVVPIYTRIVPADQYGMYSLFQSWNELLCIFTTLNMWNYLYSKGLIKFETKKNIFTSSLIGLGWCLTLVFLAIYILGKNVINSFVGLSTEVFVIMFIDWFLRPSYEYWCARQRFEYTIKHFCVTAIIISLLTPVASLILIHFLSNKGNALIIGKSVVTIPIYLFICILLLKKGRQLRDKDVWRYALRFNIPLVPHFLSGVILAQSDRIMIERYCSTKEVAMYSVAYSVAAVMLIINSALNDSIIPWEYKSIKNGTYKNIHKVSFTALLAVSVCNLMVIMFAPEIIYLMAPSEYQPSMYVIAPVAISNLFIFMFNLFANIEYYFEETKFVMIASCIAAGLNILLNSIFIPIYGFTAAGYTTLVSYMIYAFMHYCFMHYCTIKHGIEGKIYNVNNIFMVGLLTTVIGLLANALYELLYIRIPILAVVVAIVCVKRNYLMSLVREIKTSK